MITAEKMRAEHLDAVHTIEEASFAIPWSKNEIRRDMEENEHAMYFVAVERQEDGSEKIAGYAGMWHVVNEGHINNIAVDEACRRQGAGSLLMECLIKTAKSLGMIGLTLEVRVGNRAAMGLYHKYGFKAEGIRKNYYSDTKEDAVIMWKYFEQG